MAIVRGLTLVFTVAGFFSACGKTSNDDETGTDLGADDNVASEVIQSNTQESIDALGEETSAALSLVQGIENLTAKEFDMTRECTASGDTAIVSLTVPEFEKTVTRETALVKRSRTISGEG